MTLNYCKSIFFYKISVTAQIWEATTAKQMKIDSYCHRQNCSSLFIFQRCNIAGHSPPWVSDQNSVCENGPIFNLCMRKCLTHSK